MKILLTGIKPTGQPHLGNYTGAVQPALQHIQNSNNKSFLFIADYHALTAIQDPVLFSQAVYQAAGALLACGADPKKTILYRQSDIPELFELYWILSCLTPKGWLNRAHSYKAHIQQNIQNKREDKEHGIHAGLFNYPVLMAADILLFQADCVPVGPDQAQHLEITRNLAEKFNHHYKSSLMTLPQNIQEKNSVSLPGLDGRKMSKSYNNHIPLFCSEKELKNKVMKIKTDSLPPSAPKDPLKSIIFQIFKEFAQPKQTQELQNKMLKGCSWGEAKIELLHVLENELKSKRKIYNTLMEDTRKIDQILKEGAVKARKQAQKTLTQVRKAVGAE